MGCGFCVAGDGCGRVCARLMARCSGSCSLGAGAGAIFGMLFGVLFAVRGAVRGAGVQALACFLLSGAYAGVFFFWGGLTHPLKQLPMANVQLLCLVRMTVWLGGSTEISLHPWARWG